MKQLEAKWVHMIGIGGAGMSGIAMVLKENGYQVSGSDLKLSSVTERLEKIGIRVYEGHRSEQLAREVDTVVYSSAVPASNSELVEARVRGLAILGRGQMLALLANSHRAISIAGAHGKTTTTSMIATVLLDSGLDPSFITGGELQSNGMSAYTGRGDYFVLEADESDGSFLELFPFISVVTMLKTTISTITKVFKLCRVLSRSFWPRPGKAEWLSYAAMIPFFKMPSYPNRYAGYAMDWTKAWNTRCGTGRLKVRVPALRFYAKADRWDGWNWPYPESTMD